MLVGIAAVLVGLLAWLLPRGEGQESTTSLPPERAGGHVVDHRGAGTEVGESREAIRDQTHENASVDTATLDLTITGLPHSDLRWLLVDSPQHDVRDATPGGTMRCRLSLVAGTPQPVFVERSRLSSAAPCYFPRLAIGTYTLKPGEVRHVRFDFGTVPVVRGRVLGRHGAKHAAITAQIEQPPEAPGAAADRFEFKLLTDAEGRFSMFELPRGKLSLFHSGVFPRSGVGPKLFDRHGEDRWDIPRAKALGVQTEKPLHGVRFERDGKPIAIEKDIYRNRGPGLTTHATAVHMQDLERSSTDVFEYHIRNVGSFQRQWRKLEITRDLEIVVPLPSTVTETGSLAIPPASEAERRARETNAKLGFRRTWIVKASSVDGRIEHKLPRKGDWRIELAPGTYRLEWHLGKRRIATTLNREVVIRAGKTSRVSMERPQFRLFDVGIANWKQIPAAQRPDHLSTPDSKPIRLDDLGRARIELAAPVAPPLTFELHRTGFTGSITASARIHADHIELTIPTDFGCHRIRVPKRHDKSIHAMAIPTGKRFMVRVGSAADAAGWMHVYTNPGERLSVLVFEWFSIEGKSSGIAVRGVADIAGSRTERSFDFGGRFIDVNLERGTTHATAWVELATPLTPAGWWGEFKQRVEPHGRIWIPDGTKSLYVRIENQSPRAIPAARISNPLKLKR